MRELAACDVLISCQGGEYTSEVYAPLRANGWNGYWIDAASTLRMSDDAVIILDPVNKHRIEEGTRARPAHVRRRQLHRQPDADGCQRALQERACRVDDHDDVSGRLRRAAPRRCSSS